MYNAQVSTRTVSLGSGAMPFSFSDAVARHARRLHEEARPRRPDTGPGQHPVCRQGWEGLRHRGQSARESHRALREQGDWGVPLAQYAVRIMAGERIADFGLPVRHEDMGYYACKEAVMPFGRFPGAETMLGPEMKSTGEVMGIARDFPERLCQDAARHRLLAAHVRKGLHLGLRPREAQHRSHRTRVAGPGLLNRLNRRDGTIAAGQRTRCRDNTQDAGSPPLT